jgi:NodT family efflux transporter outer membrane factor (OMF) lipoprotein
VLLAGCATSSGPEGDAAVASVEVPVQWQGPPVADAGSAPTDTPALDSTALARWWRSFDDPLLGELIERALTANTDLQLARSRVVQARALRDVSAAAGSPNLDLSGSVGTSQSGRGSSALRSNSYRAGLDASWEIDIWGRIGAGTRAAELDLATTRADRATTEASVAAEVGLAYVQLRGSQRQLRIARDNLAALAQTTQITEWRTQAGLVSSLDAEQARASTAQQRASLGPLQNTVVQAQHRIAVLLGQAPTTLRAQLGTDETDTAVASAASTPPIPSAAPMPAGVPAQVLRQRPDVRAAELSIEAESQRLAVSRATGRPSFAISGTLALQAATLGALGNPAATLATLGAAVNWPLFDGGARAAQIQAQQAVQAQARIRYQAVVLTALEDVENALADLSYTQNRLAAYEAGVASARNALLLARQRYQAGLVDFATLLEAQRTALSLDNGLAAAQTDLSLGRIRLNKALGGGWAEEE